MKREVLSSLTGVTPRTLQRWEKEGKLPRAKGVGRGNKATYDHVIIDEARIAIFPDRIKYVVWKPTGVLIALNTGEIIWRSPSPNKIIIPF